jgi:putative sigma-54 modulation protein
MNVEITGRHIVITPAIREYVMKRLKKLVKVLGDDLNFHVIIDVQKENQSAEILLKTKSLNLAGKSKTEDMYVSINKAIEKIERQILKRKGKIVEGKRHRAKTASAVKKSGITQAAYRKIADDSEGIREEETNGKPMTVEEAVLELNHSEYPFIVFRNSESGIVNVLYRRKDSTLGLIRT